MQRPTSWLLVLAITAPLALLLACVLVFPQLLYPSLTVRDLQGVTDPERRVELRQAQSQLQNNARTLFPQAVAGVVLVAGVAATWWQIQISRKDKSRSGSPEPSTSLVVTSPTCGLAVSTLERIAKNSEIDRSTITEVLVAFVRGHSPWLAGAADSPEPHPTPTVDEDLPWLRDRAPDVQAAMIVLSRRRSGRDERRLDLGLVDLRHAYLARARLSGMRMRHANLARAWMRHIRLEDADLADTDLRQANLEDANLMGTSLRGAYFQQARLKGARLQGASLLGAQLQKADLREADLRNANLDDADLRGSDLRGARLDGASLVRIRADATTIWPEGFDARGGSTPMGDIG